MNSSTKPTKRQAHYPGWRRMTAAQRYNAKMHRLFEAAKAEGRGLVGSSTAAPR